MTWTEFNASGLAGWSKGDGALLVVMLHGGPGLSEYTDGLCDEVLAADPARLRVARFQQRGQAPSVLDGPFTAEQAVADVITVIDHLGAETAVVAGHSWGGHLAFHVAVAHPDRVAAVFSIDALGAIGDGGSGTMNDVIGGRIGEEGQAQLGALAAEELSPDEALTRQLGIIWPGYFADPVNAPAAPPIVGAFAPYSGFMTDAGRLLGEGFLEAALPKVSMPSIHVIGKHSPIEPAANEKTAALMAGAIVELLDTGHFPWLEQPGSMTAATRKLLAAIDQ